MWSQIAIKCIGNFSYIVFDHFDHSLPFAALRLFLSISRLACRYASEGRREGGRYRGERGRPPTEGERASNYSAVY